MTYKQCIAIRDHLLQEVSQLNKARNIGDNDAKFHAQGAAINILISLSGAFNAAAMSADDR